jgi:hypothetical protein
MSFWLPFACEAEGLDPVAVQKMALEAARMLEWQGQKIR